jgi:hypothetical protein
MIVMIPNATTKPINAGDSFSITHPYIATNSLISCTSPTYKMYTTALCILYIVSYELEHPSLHTAQEAIHNELISESIYP